MSKEAWSDIVKFFLPLFDKNATPSKSYTIRTATEKLETFESVYSSKWDVLMLVKLQIFQSKLSSLANSQNDEIDAID